MGTPISSINVQQLHQLCQENANICLIDVRTTEEWEEGYIPRAQHIPKDSLHDSVVTKMSGLVEPIYLYCRAGIRSQQAAGDLRALGYQAVYSVDGGILAWLAAGYPLTAVPLSRGT